MQTLLPSAPLSLGLHPGFLLTTRGQVTAPGAAVFPPETRLVELQRLLHPLINEDPAETYRKCWAGTGSAQLTLKQNKSLGVLYWLP